MFALQMLDKIKHYQASVQICTISGSYTLLRQLYRIILCLYGQGVQICTPMPVFSQITIKLLQTVSNTTQIQGKL